MASQLSGRCLMRWLISGHHLQDVNKLSKLKYHTTTACLCRSSNVSPKQQSSISTSIKKSPLLHLPHNASSNQGNSTGKFVEELQNKMCQLSVASPLSSGLYLSPPPTLQYKLPAHVGNELTEQIIVDPAVSNVVRECPSIVLDREIEEPVNTNKVIDMPPFKEEISKQAKVTNIILIRRKKMRKHKLKKFRKRMKFLRRMVIANRKRKKRKLWEAHLEKFKFKELTDDMIADHCEKLEEKRNCMAAYYRAEAGLSQNTKEKVKGQPPTPPSKITPTPILPSGAMKH